MNQCIESLTLGSPRFTDTSVARCAKEQGVLAAWRSALAQGPERAAAIATGDFAVALREPSGRTFLAVDRFSVHTLCYRLRGDELIFASRADELGDGAEIDLQALFDYVYFHVIPSPRTVFQGVF